jgi:hypothetical protein
MFEPTSVITNEAIGITNWISVKDELPPKDMPVIVCIATRIHIGEFDGGNAFYLRWPKFGHSWGVTSWCWLPKAPEGEE